MSIHIGARPGEIAESVLLCGDPLRARFIAETYLKDVNCYNTVRNMLGYTGFYQGKQISVQGTGMGQPSLAIYVRELLDQYGVKKMIRVGTCGAILPEIELGEIIIAQGASTDSNANRMLFDGLDYAPIADFNLMFQAYQIAQQKNIQFRVGGVFSTDFFYLKDDPARWKIWQEHHILCTDMETSMLYTLAAGSNAQALSLLTVTDNIITKSFCTAEEREKGIKEIMQIALEIV